MISDNIVDLFCSQLYGYIKDLKLQGTMSQLTETE